MVCHFHAENIIGHVEVANKAVEHSGEARISAGLGLCLASLVPRTFITTRDFAQNLQDKPCSYVFSTTHGIVT